MITDNLPVEVVAEIFCRLPIKSILRCTSVCKSWYSLIKNPNFITTHLHRTLTSNDYPRLFLHDLNCKWQTPRTQFFLRFDDKDFRVNMPLSSHLPFDPDDMFDISGSCNGLVLLFKDNFCWGKYGYKFILWNPSIRKFFLLPLPRFIFCSRSFVKNFTALGFDSRTQDYKVLRIMNPPVENRIHFRAELYSLNSNSWKNITHIIPTDYKSFDPTAPAFVNGALHWIDRSRIERKDVIMVFDVRDEMFRRISLPESLVSAYPYSFNRSIKVYAESTIAVIYGNSEACQSDIWVMKEYGVEASWVKLASVGRRYRGRSVVLGFRNNGEVLLRFRRSSEWLTSQNLDSLRIKNLIKMDKTKGAIDKAYSYMESLALLDKGYDVETSSDSDDSTQVKRTKT